MNDDTIITQATPADAGCWIDGHWGQYGIARLVEIAEGMGYNDAEMIDYASRHLASMARSNTFGITDDEHEALTDSCDDVEVWMNDHLAPEGFAFGWHDGEFFLWSDEDWEAESD